MWLRWRKELSALLPGTGLRIACCKKRHTALPHERQQPFHFDHHFFPLALVHFGGFPTAGTALVFGFASKLDGGVQLGPHLLCEFDWFKKGGFVLRFVQNGKRFSHNAIVRSFGGKGMAL